MVADLMKRLAERGVLLRADGDRLVVNAPKGALDGDLTAAIRDHKPEILAFLAEAAEALGHQDPVPARPDAPPGPMTVAQERLWYVDRMEPEAATYNLPGAWRLQGPLDEAALVRAVEAFAGRHEILRWTFPERGGAPSVALAGPASVEILDLAGQGEAALHASLDREARRPFDLASEPAFRAFLLRLGPEDRVLYVVTHAIAWDGWSFDLLLREVAALYEAFAAGRPDPLPAPPVRFGDYAAWLRERADGERVRGQLDWWEGRLRGDLPALDLPFDRPRPATPRHEGAREYLRMPGEVSAGVAALAREERATPYMVLLTAWAALLRRYAGRDDLVITTPVRGRLRPELEELVGVFTNTLFLRTGVAGDRTFRQALRRVRDEVLEAFARQEAPVDLLLDRVESAGDLHRTALYQVMFSYQNTAGRVTRVGGAEVSFVTQAMHAVYADLNLWVKDAPGALMGAVDYRRDLFDAETVRRIIGHLETLLRGALADPDLPLDRVPVLSADQREEVLALGRGPEATLAEDPERHLAAALAARLELGPQDRLLAIAQPHTPRGRLERALAEAAGATLEEVPPDVAEDPWDLRDELEDAGATAMVAPPSLWRALVDAGWEPEGDLLAVSLGAGLPADLAAALLERTGRLWSVFAPAETGLPATARRLGCPADAGSLGAALPGVRIAVEDVAGDPAPPGVRGRLRVQVLDAPPILTAERVRLRPGGDLEPAGRADGRVRIGDRLVDPRLAEERLAALPDVREAVVDAPRGGGGSRRLVAWVAFEPGSASTATELRGALGADLPPDHVPGVVVTVEALPRTSGGAVDRARLPDPFAGGEGRAEPETPVEQVIASVWREHLGVEAVGRSDSFAELGGSSLHAVRVVLELQRRLGWQPSPRLLFFQNLRQVAERAPEEAALRAAEAL